MVETFTELGIPFPLFDPPASESPDYRGLGKCSVCATTEVQCFEVDDLITTCNACGIEVAVRGESDLCRSCRKYVAWPDSWEDNLMCCYRCLRAGRAAFSKDSTLGMVTWDQAKEGLTHGLPGLETDEFDLVPSDSDAEWMQAKVSPVLLLELVRTPAYVSWQGERWQFCCGQPMIYVGEWKEAEFKQRTKNGDGSALFNTARIEGVDDSFWGHLKNVGGPYMFRCPQCHGLRGHYDMD